MNLDDRLDGHSSDSTMCSDLPLTKEEIETFGSLSSDEKSDEDSE